MRCSILFACMGVAAAATHSYAWEFRSRFVERIGNTDVVLDDSVAFAAGSTHRIRIQFGVFDDINGEAPAGGLNGWSEGAIDVFGGGTWTRTPGRLVPFATFGQNGDPPLPDGDPFTSLRNIDGSIVTQGFSWGCDASGQPLPMPEPVVRGRNTFASVYEITVAIDPDQELPIRLAISGQLTAADRWGMDGTPIPPDCEAGEPGQVVYFAVLNGNRPTLTRELMIIPAPASLILLAGLAAPARRRRQ